MNKNKNSGHTLINSQTQDLTQLISNIEEWQLNSLLFTHMPSNSDQHTNLSTPILNKKITEHSTTRTNSIISSTVLTKNNKLFKKNVYSDCGYIYYMQGYQP